jgi:hypothetical protein
LSWITISVIVDRVVVSVVASDVLEEEELIAAATKNANP